jgi:hypothetical protein
MKHIFFLISVLLLSNCTEQKGSSSFEWIDYTSFSIQGLHSLKIYKNGKIYTMNHFDGEYYVASIDNNEIYKINEKVKDILKTKIDSSYNSECWDHCFAYCLIINTKNKKIKTICRGDPYSDKDIAFLNILVYQLDSLSICQSNLIDTSIVFESWSKNLVPPPPPPPEVLEQKVRFTAPKKKKKDTIVLNNNLDSTISLPSHPQ